MLKSGTTGCPPEMLKQSSHVTPKLSRLTAIKIFSRIQANKSLKKTMI